MGRRGLRAWELRCIQELMDRGADPPVILESAAARGERDEESAHRHGTVTGIERLYQRLFFQISALESVPRDRAAGTAGRTDPFESGKSERARLDRASVVESARKLDLDFILGFGEPSEFSSFKDAARYGVWWFSDASGRPLSIGVPFFHDVMGWEQIVHASLVHAPADGGDLEELRHGCYSIALESYAEDLDRVLRDLSKWPAWVWQALRKERGHSTVRKQMPEPASPGKPFPLQDICLWPGRLLASKIAHRMSNVFLRPQWNVAVLKRPIQTLLSERAVDDAVFVDIGSDKNIFWADPFGIPVEGGVEILFEEFDFTRNKGQIASISVSGGGDQTGPVTIFDRQFHLSYPFLFEDEGSIYCVPEAGRSGRVEIYRAVRFRRIGSA